MLSNILIYSHIAFGTVCLISGIIPMISKKGGKLHRQTGKLFFWSMFGIFITALGIISFVRFNFFLLIIAVLSFYLCFTGYRVLHRKKPGEQTWIDWSGAIITFIAGLSFIYAGTTRYIEIGSFDPLTILLFFFGPLTSLNAGQDMRIFLLKEIDDKLWWFYHHMSAFCGAYIAAVTAFAVQMSNTHLSHLEYSWLAWILPGIVGAPLISFWKRRYMKKHGKVNTSNI